MKRSFWIAGTVIFAVLVIGGGITWWLLATAQRADEPTALDTSAFVYTGEDLAGFLIDQDAAREVTGTSIELGAVGNEFYVQEDLMTFDPIDCASVRGQPTVHPGGFRNVSGTYPETADVAGPGVRLTQVAFQFATVRGAADAFLQIAKAGQLCDQFVESFENGQGKMRANDVRLAAVDLGPDGSDTIAALLTFTGNEEKLVGVVTVRVNNVITSAEVESSGSGPDPRVDESMVRDLASAVLKQAARAEKAKATGGVVDKVEHSPAAPTEEPAWLIDFGSIGPINITMTAQQAADALGSTEPLTPDMEFCAYYSLGEHNGTSVSGLAESQGAYGQLDSISTFASWGTEPLDVDDLPRDRPRTATGISTGSTMAELQAAYPGQLEIHPHTYIEGGHYVYLYGPGETVITFDVDADDVVDGITTGRVPQAQYIEGCA